MKAWFRLVLAAALLVLTGPAASAYSEHPSPQEGQTVADVTSLAVGAPQYTAARKGAPSREEFVAILAAEGAKVSKYRVVSYDEVARGVLQSAGRDMYAMARVPAAKVFRDHAAEYADAYVVPTVTMSRRTAFFFDIFRAGTDELIYAYEIVLDNNDPDDVKTYSMAVGQFYSHFGGTVQAQKKERAAKEKAEQKAREKEARRRTQSAGK